MKIEESSKDKIIIYLKLKKTLSKDYLHLSLALSALGLTLIPFSMDELRKIKGLEKKYVMVFTDDLSSKSRFEKFKRNYLDFALRSESLFLFHYTSFGEGSKNSNKTSRLLESRGQRDMSVLTSPLPMKISTIIYQVVDMFYKENSKSHKWEGGTRAKLPFDVLKG